MPQNHSARAEPDMPIAGRNLACAVIGALLLAAGSADAQQPAPPAPKPAPRPAPQHPTPVPAQQAQAPVDQNPQRTTASYGDWTVRCETAPGPPPQKHCEMDQLAQTQV